jgi:hypothetical protein
MKRPTPAPNVYSMTGWIRFVGPLIVVIGAFMLNASLSGPIYMRGGVQFTPQWIFSSSAVLLGGIVLTASAFTARFKISADSVEIGNVFGKKKLALDAIRGRRQYATGSGRLTAIHFKLEPKENGPAALTFQNHFNFDDRFWDWFDQLPDLDSEESPSVDQPPLHYR